MSEQEQAADRVAAWIDQQVKGAEPRLKKQGLTGEEIIAERELTRAALEGIRPAIEEALGKYRRVVAHVIVDFDERIPLLCAKPPRQVANMAWKRFQDQASDPDNQVEKSDLMIEYAIEFVVHPDRNRVIDLFEEYSAVVAQVTGLAHKFMGLDSHSLGK